MYRDKKIAKMYYHTKSKIKIAVVACIIWFYVVFF